MRQLFELRACFAEYYDCPDNGWTKICDTYETIAFSYNKSKLDEIATDLTSGYKGRGWSLKRTKELRKLYPGYDDMRETKYEVVDVSEKLI